MNISDRLSAIKRRLKEDVSKDEQRGLYKEKFQLMSEPQQSSDDMFEYRADGGIIGPVYRAEGGFGEQVQENVEAGLPDFLMKKLREAFDAGVDPSDIEGVMKNNALKSRNARVRGALMKGGMSALGKVNENTARGLAGAEHGTAAPVYDSPLGALGQGFTEAGAAEGKYNDELTRIDEASAKAKKKAAGKGDSKTYRQIQEALLLVDAASVAGDIVNGWNVVVLSEEDQAKLDESKGWIDSIKDTVSETVAATSALFSRGKEVRREILSRAAKAQAPESYIAFIRLERLATAMAQTVLAQQTGTKTDFDFEVASKTLFNIEKQSTTWQPQLQDALTEMYSQSANKGPLDTINEEFAGRTPVVANDEPIKTGDGSGGDSTATSNETPAVGTNTSGTGGEGSELKYPEDKPLVIPEDISKGVAGFGGYAASLAWLITQDLTDEDYVNYNGQIGTYKSFKES